MFAHFRSITLRKRYLVLISVCALFGVTALVVYGVYYRMEHQAYWQAEHELSLTHDRAYQQYFEPHIDVFFKQEGIQGMIDRTIQAFTNGQINMVVCHSLAHDIGHYGGYESNFPDIQKYLSKKNLDFCGSGFIHGVEGQLAFETYPQNVDDLYSFCKMIEPFNPYYAGCYHGAGHSFKEENKDPNEALKWCDKLKIDDTISRSDCYRGVFSQNVDDATQLGKDDVYLLDYCASLPSEELQGYCAMELNGLNTPATADQDQITEKFKECTDPRYSMIVQEGCVRSVAGVVADNELGLNRSITPPPYILTLPDNLIQAYITLTYGAFLKTVNLEPDRSLESFCSTFKDTNEYDFCAKLIHKS